MLIIKISPPASYRAAAKQQDVSKGGLWASKPVEFE
jgi:hypothetical protein